MSRVLSFKLLGSLQALVDGEPLRLRSARQRAVLTMLLLASGQAVSIDALIEAVWRGDPPSTARNQIAICVTALRKIFRDEAGVDDLIDTVHPGYALNLKDHRLDLRELNDAVARARAAAGSGRLGDAADHFEHALALWCGPALEGIDGGGIDVAADRLTELWLDLNEEYAALQLQLGRHRSVVAGLAPIVAEHPLREQARAHLMLAHHLSGRRAEALEVYREGRRILVQELGIEPGPRLQELHRQVLAGAKLDGSASPPPVAGSVPRQLPLPQASFAGRTREIAVLNDLLTPADGRGPLPIAVIRGVGGVGKSSLAVHWANQVASHFPDGHLFMDLQGFHEHDQPVPPMSALDRALRALGVPSARIPTDLQERAALYRSILDGKRLLIVLDNVHSATQTNFLLPGRGGCCVLITSRDPLDELTSEYGAAQITLRAMTVDEARDMLAAVIGAERVEAEPEAVVRLIELCDRLPLALRIAATRLLSGSYWSLQQLTARLEDRRRRLDVLSPDEGGVRAGFWLSYRELSPRAALLYRRLSLLAVPDFAAWVGAAVLDVDLHEAEDLIEQLVSAQLLEVSQARPGEPVRFRFQDLLRLFAWERAQVEESETERRESLERVFGTMLTLADLAHQQLYGKSELIPDHVSRGVDLPPRAVSELLGDAIEWFESERESVVGMVRQAAQNGCAAHAWLLTARAVPLFEVRTYLEDWRRTAESALVAARVAGDARGAGTMLRSLGTLAIYHRRYAKAQTLLSSAMEFLERSDDLQGRAIARRNLALCARFSGELDDAARHCQEALDLFADAEDLSGLSHALGLLAQIELERGNTGLGIELTNKAISTSHEAGSLRSKAQNFYRLAEALLRARQPSRAEQVCQDVIALTRGQGDRLGEAHGLRALGEAQWRQNRPVEAEVNLMRALKTAEDLGDRFLRARVETDLACAEALCGGQGVAARLDWVYQEFRSLNTPAWERRIARLRDAMWAHGQGVPVDCEVLADHLDAP
ncbi:winged helix-turn-helix domain-containing protein [Streptomyces cellulosae]|nr:winged helix-turn-helix domain-containing protein [Streptomyces cellulosae]